MSESEEVRTWKALHTPEDISKLMGSFGNFHDACVREVHVVTGHYVNPHLSMTVDWKTTVHILVQRQYAPLSAIELRFEEVAELRILAPAPNYESIILNAAFLHIDGLYYWADSAYWTPDSHDEGATWVAARKVCWRDASEWMGPEIRYGKPTASPR